MRNGSITVARVVQLISCGVVALTLLAGPAPSFGEGAQLKLTVSATVLPRASLQMLSGPASLVITAADIARGYVDVTVPTQLAIRCNSSRGYTLDFAVQGDFLRAIRVKGLANELQLSPYGGVVMQPAAVSGITKATLQLGFRLELAESAQAGTYAWPMRLSVTPI